MYIYVVKLGFLWNICKITFHTFVYINVLDHVISLVAKQLIKSQNDRAIDKTADVMFKKKIYIFLL